MVLTPIRGLLILGVLWENVSLLVQTLLNGVGTFVRRAHNDSIQVIARSLASSIVDIVHSNSSEELPALSNVTTASLLFLPISQPEWEGVREYVFTLESSSSLDAAGLHEALTHMLQRATDRWTQRLDGE